MIVNRIGCGGGAKINGVIATYTVMSGKSISAGDFVENTFGGLKPYENAITGVAKTSGSSGERVKVYIPEGASL